MDHEGKEQLAELYATISNDLIEQLEANHLDPKDVAENIPITEEELQTLLSGKHNDYLEYREIDHSIKRLAKKNPNQ